MPPGVPRQFVVVGANATLASQAEQVLATLSGISTFGTGQTVALFGYVPLNPSNADVTGVELNVRRNSLTGTALTALDLDVPAVGALAKGGTYIGAWTDTPGDVANLAYVLTAKTLAGTHTAAILVPTLVAIVQ
jgi:hypothetical protein